MPIYGFFCNTCEQPFSRNLTIEEFEEGPVACPHCGSEDIEQQEAA